jgi:choline dehydrogenase-like flavoprotein
MRHFEHLKTTRAQQSVYAQSSEAAIVKSSVEEIIATLDEQIAEVEQKIRQHFEWKRTNAWGHHASCTAAIGDPGAGGVVSGDFRVHGVRNLRIVDASVFPRIPGFFIAGSIYTIGEKAADVILSVRNE